MPFSLLNHHPYLLQPSLRRPHGGGGGHLCIIIPSCVKPIPLPRSQPTVLTRRVGSVRCMANPRRVKMVAKQIQRELSDMLLTDKVLQCAVLPEAALGADQYLSSLTTISDVEVSSDLQVVKVYISVFGDERGRDVAVAGLKSKSKYVRSELGRRMKLRLTPEVRFIEDESLERGSRVIAILDRLKAEKEGVANEDEEFDSSDRSRGDQDTGVDDPDYDDDDEEEEEEEEDGDDDGVIYVD